MAQQLHRLLAAFAAASCVVVLHVSGRPSTVCFAVAVDEQIILDAIERVKLRRSAPHVFKEVLERCAPTFADGNATPTVVIPLRVFLVRAPTQHLRPRRVLWGLLSTCTRAMFSTGLSSGDTYFDAKAPARFGHAVSEHATCDLLFCPANAVAEPHQLLSSTFVTQPQNCPSAEHQPSQIILDRHRWILVDNRQKVEKEKPWHRG